MPDPVKAARAETVACVELRKALEHDGYADDPQLILDTLEGETDFNEALLLLADQVQELKAQSVGIQSRLDDLKTRQDRVKASAETLRNIILQSMDTAGVPTIKGDCITMNSACSSRCAAASGSTRSASKSTALSTTKTMPRSVR